MVTNQNDLPVLPSCQNIQYNNLFTWPAKKFIGFSLHQRNTNVSLYFSVFSDDVASAIASGAAAATSEVARGAETFSKVAGDGAI